MFSFVRLLFLLNLVIGCSAPALAMEDTPQNRAEEASRYLQAVPAEAVAADMARRMAASLPQAQQQPFMAAMQRDVNIAAINSAAQTALVKVFTADELKALADFYSAPLTKSAMAKMSAYMGQVMPAIMQEVQAAAQKAQQEIGGVQQGNATPQPAQ
jgi:hypothetical protein